MSRGGGLIRGLLAQRIEQCRRGLQGGAKIKVCDGTGSFVGVRCFVRFSTPLAWRVTFVTRRRLRSDCTHHMIMVSVSPIRSRGVPPQAVEGVALMLHRARGPITAGPVRGPSEAGVQGRAVECQTDGPTLRTEATTSTSGPQPRIGRDLVVGRGTVGGWVVWVEGRGRGGWTAVARQSSQRQCGATGEDFRVSSGTSSSGAKCLSMDSCCEQHNGERETPQHVFVGL